MIRVRSGLWIAVTMLVPAGYGVAQAGIGASPGLPANAAPVAPVAPPASSVPAVVPPEHPATEETLRRYFEVCHFATHNREGLIEQFARQQKTLPAWYPPDLWTETVDAVVKIDAVEVAIPVYRQYYSEEGTQNAIRLFVTPSGQAMLAKVYGKTLEQEGEGDDAVLARRKALAAERAQEDSEIRRMVQSMTPKEEREVAAFVQSAEWKRMNALSEQVYAAFNQAYLARQKQVMHDVALPHKEELQKALREYKAAHPGYEP